MRSCTLEQGAITPTTKSHPSADTHRYFSLYLLVTDWQQYNVQYPARLPLLAMRDRENRAAKSVVEGETTPLPYTNGLSQKDFLVLSTEITNEHDLA